MSSIIRIQHLPKKMIRDVVASIEQRKDLDKSFVEFLKKAETVRSAKENDIEILVFDEIPSLFKTKEVESYIPTLYVLNYFLNSYRIHITPAVVVDEGAVNPLKRGADVMIPGIRKVVKGFQKGDVVGVLEPGEKYFIVVGIALLDSSSITPGAKGKCIANISRIDDEVWRLSLQLVKHYKSS